MRLIVLPRDGVALHAARVRGRTQLVALARDGADPPERPRAGHGDVVAAAAEVGDRLVAEPRLDRERARLEAARVERRDQVIGVPLGRVDRLLQVRARGRRGARGRAAPTAPAGRRPACRRRATARRRAARGPARASCAAACAARATTAGPPRARTSAPACRAASRAPGSSASSAASRRSASPRSGSRSDRRRRGERCPRGSARPRRAQTPASDELTAAVRGPAGAPRSPRRRSGSGARRRTRARAGGRAVRRHRRSSRPGRQRRASRLGRGRARAPPRRAHATSKPSSRRSCCSAGGPLPPRGRLADRQPAVVDRRRRLERRAPGGQVLAREEPVVLAREAVDLVGDEALVVDAPRARRPSRPDSASRRRQVAASCGLRNVEPGCGAGR